MTITYPEQLGNKYTLLNLIGTGGMAEVFRGKLSGAEGFEKPVVLKKLLAHFAHDPEIVGHFISEAKLAALLQHENIAQIYDFGELDGSYFIAMEYLLGKDLQSVMQRARELHDPMATEQALFIVAKICEGMEYAHSLKDFRQQPLHIIHRDLSPHNIFITFEGRVKIIDFGIARAELFDNKTQMGVAKGKISYMSPEQLAAERIDQRSDIFSIGILLYEMLSGKRMYSGDTATMIRKCIHVEYDKLQVVCPDLHPAIYEILEKALEKDVDRRYQSCAEMLADVEESLFSINKRPGIQPLGKYLGRLFSEELNAEKIDQSRFLLPADDAANQTVRVTATNRSIAERGTDKTKESALDRNKTIHVTGGFPQTKDEFLKEQPRRHSRTARLVVLAICCMLVVIVIAVWMLARDWDIGESDPLLGQQAVSTPSQEPSQTEALPETAVHTGPGSSSSTSTTDTTQQLLGQAEAILSQKRPEPHELETAQKLYQQVQEKDPNSKEALAGMDRIREHYRAATEEALKASNLSQATNHMSKGMFLAPKDGRFSSLQESFEGQKQKLINKLAEKAEAAMKKNHLTTPVQDNAFQYYSEILKLDRQNTIAKNGMVRLADRYADLAEDAYQNLRIPQAREYVRQGLAVSPHHKQLLELQRDLTRSKPGMFFKSIEKSFNTMSR